MRYVSNIIESMNVSSMNITSDEFKEMCDITQQCQSEKDKEYVDFVSSSSFAKKCINQGATKKTMNVLFDFVRLSLRTLQTDLHQTYENACGTLYYCLSNKSMKYITNVLGSGCEGFAIKIDDARVLKIYFEESIPVEQRRFYEYCKSHSASTGATPIVYRVGKRYVIMEAFPETGSRSPKTSGQKQIADFHERIEQNVAQYITYWSHPRKFAHVTDDMNDVERYDYAFVCDVMNMRRATNQDIESFGDFTFENIARRDNGTFVFFDI